MYIPIVSQRFEIKELPKYIWPSNNMRHIYINSISMKIVIKNIPYTGYWLRACRWYGYNFKINLIFCG